MFHRILAGADGSVTAARAVRAAAELAVALGAELHVATAVPPSTDPFTGTGGWTALPLTTIEPDLPTELGPALRAILGEIGTNATFHAARGDPGEALVRIAEEIDADLIVVGNRNMRGLRRILGSVPNSVAHAASCSVLVYDSVSEPGE